MAAARFVLLERAPGAVQNRCMDDTSRAEDRAAAFSSDRTGPPTPFMRPIGRVNWLGVWTLYAKEVQRFLYLHQRVKRVNPLAALANLTRRLRPPQH